MSMMDFVEEQGVSIIANGTFNPAIFHPAWFRRHGLLSEEEEETAKIDMVHPEISQFQVPGLQFDIQTERILLQAAAEPLVRAADIFSSLFADLLPHTPIKSVGINYWSHFRLSSWSQRQNFGRALAPIEPWGEFGQLMDSKDKNMAGGFSTLSFKAAYPANGDLGSVNVSMQPSVKIENDSGVFMNVNHHFSDSGKSVHYPNMISEKFDDVIKYSRRIISHMISVGRES
ncbi:MAG: hypothetical protein AAGB23_09855 [Pseudomonadota bacterium]